MRISKKSTPSLADGAAGYSGPPASAPAHLNLGVAPIVHYSILALALASFVMSSFCFIKVKQVATIVARQTATVGEVVQKLTAHPEARDYFSVAPLGVMQIDLNNIQHLQSQLKGLNVFAVGNYLVQWPKEVFMYNYAQDKILSRMEIQPAPPGRPPGSPTAPEQSAGKSPAPK